MTEENIKLFDSELKVMDVLWKDGDVPAKYVADTLNREVGWNKNTTYTLIKRCINKGAIERTEPGFMCHALIAKEQVQDLETDELIDKIYDGSVDKLFAALLGRKNFLWSRLRTQSRSSVNWNEVMYMSLLQMSFLGTVIILLIVVLRAVLINRLPKKTFLILWWIALIRLLVPFP